MYYAKSTKGFYPHQYPRCPTDLVEITHEYYTALQVGMSAGKVLSHEAGGLPILIDPPIYIPTNDDHRAAIAARRWQAEISGITWQGYGIATDRESQQKMSDERSAVKDGLRTDGKGWKCLDLESGVATFRPTTNAEIMEITEAAYRYVSACFDREGELLKAVDDGSFTESMLSEGWPE